MCIYYVLINRKFALVCGNKTNWMCNKGILYVRFFQEQDVGEEQLTNIMKMEEGGFSDGV